ncbi:hypothetical protein LX36DRAFT_229996 [Colletotrichum falcatum]|nr:hypothetical protein LX36DRAFT_229996 [Colletotrichum falcatum]
MRCVTTTLLTIGLLVGSALTAPLPSDGQATISPLPNGPNGIPAHNDKRSPVPSDGQATINPLPNGPNGIPAHNDKRSDPSSQPS